MVKLFPSIFISLLLPLAVAAQSVQIQDGAILAEFSVSDSTKIYFSQGNLQYQASTGTWRFAEHQWDFVGDSIKGNVYENGIKSDNAKISSSYDGWIDLFGWGTSSYNGKNPYMTSTDYSDYGDGYNDIAGTNYDWGVYNAISNGENQVGLWKTLTHDEWEYLTKTRANASGKKGVASVNGVNGLILLPDEWTLPEGILFKNGLANDAGSEFYATVNNYTASEWSKMEANGAVFLPAAGSRGWNGLLEVGSYGNYWSSTTLGNDYNLFLTFNSYHVGMYFCQSHLGLSVRLVQDVK